MMRILRYLPLCGLLWGFAVAAAGAETIDAVAFQQHGAKTVSEDLLRFSTRCRTGMEYDRKAVDQDIKRLYETGYFSDVSAEFRPDGNGGNQLVFRLKVCPELKAVEFSGNEKYRADELLKQIKITVGVPLNSREVRDSTAALREFYGDKGYRDAEISPEVVTNADGTVTLRFQIKENLQLKINNVTFEGNTVFRNWDLRHSLVNQYSYLSWVPMLNFGLLDREQLNVDKARIRDLYWDRGYLDFKIESLEIVPNEDDPEYVDLKFKFFEGEPYTLGAISFAGNTLFPDADLRPIITMKQDQVFDYKTEQSTRDGILRLYHAQGYADASCKAVRHTDVDTHKVEITFEIDEGRQYKIRQIMIVGNRFTKDEVIRRELVVYPEDPADENMVDVSRSRLLGTDMFEKVETGMINADQLGEKDVVVKVEEKNAYDVRIGAGISDIDSLFGMVEASSRNFDLFNPGNYFRGGGQRLRLQAAIGLERGALNFDFTEPWLFGIPLRLDVGVYYRVSEYEYWDEVRAGARVSLSKKIFDDFTTISGGYKIEQVNVRNMSSKMGPETRDEQGREWVSQFNLAIDRNTMDSLTNPTEGYLVGVSGAISPKALGSTENFYRVELKGQYAISFFDKAIVWNTGAKIGVVDGFGSEPAPLYERYFLGGGDTIRGFSYRDVSPLDSNGRPCGGQSMLLITTEISHPIWDFLRGAVFADLGGAWAREYDFSPHHLNMGVGYGLRIKLPTIPVPIKLDLAYPVLNQQDNESSKLRFHFSMGFSF